ncbi:hypothetical protein BH09ACT6_BH09ACT6_22420 [soil metagenome]
MAPAGVVAGAPLLTWVGIGSVTSWAAYTSAFYHPLFADARIALAVRSANYGLPATNTREGSVRRVR